MNKDKVFLAEILAMMLFVSTGAFAANEFAQDVNWTPEKMMEFVDLPNKGTLTTGFFDCMAKHAKHKPYQYCLPNEVQFQDKLVQNLAVEYYNKLPAKQKKTFEKQQKDFISFRSSRCSWTDDPKLVRNPEKITDGTVDKLKCLLDATVTRRLDLEKLTPENNE
ncbi:MAG: DUF1311 domain-containing protein [Legionella sp.]|nr:MAG: DUF1311 domain-containing protein [Legionella sp.]